jgi:hypothetical protein
MHRAGARISWTLFYQYATPGPHTFTVEVGSTGSGTASDWAAIADPVVDAYYCVDPVERTAGLHPTVFYRVRLEDASGVHVSRPVGVDGTLSRRDWTLARELIRKERLVLSKYNGVHGWLLKRKRVGPLAVSADPRTAAVDPWTGEVMTSAPAAGAYGTDRPDGYFQPVPFRIFMDPSAVDEEVDPAGSGNVDRAATKNEGRLILFPPVDTLDVFVEAETDYRYYIHLTKQLAHIRGTPLVADCALLRAPVSDPVYDVAVPLAWTEPAV